jgi:hypothetical protein
MIGIYTQDVPNKVYQIPKYCCTSNFYSKKCTVTYAPLANVISLTAYKYLKMARVTVRFQRIV